MLCLPLVSELAVTGEPMIFSGCLKDRAEAGFIIDQTEPVFLSKLCNLCLAIFFVYRPHALQLIFVDGAVAVPAGLQLQFASDYSSENFHNRTSFEEGSLSKIAQNASL